MPRYRSGELADNKSSLDVLVESCTRQAPLTEPPMPQSICVGRVLPVTRNYRTDFGHHPDVMPPPIMQSTPHTER